jgi:pilus assembly protein CpaC
MRALTGNLLTGHLPTGDLPSRGATTGKLLEIGIALFVLVAPAAWARDDAGYSAPVRLTQLAQTGSPATEPAAGPERSVPDRNIPDQNAPPMIAQPVTPPPAEIPKPFHGSVSFEAGSGKILSLTLPAANIYVADPKVAEVRPASSTSLFVFGVGAGHTTIAAVDMLGRLLADYDITVRPSAFGAREAQATISRLIPGSRVQVKPSGKGMMLTGAVANASDAAQAMMIAKGFSMGDAAPVENQMTIASPSQVTLMVKIAEMKRSTARTIGLNWQAIGTLGKIGGPAGALGVVTAITNKALTCIGGGGANTAVCPSGVGATTAAIDLLANEGLAHILAEPNLTVMSGQAASFQAGGEYPYTTPGSGANPNSISVAFKPYGVLLSFVPTVLGNGRINLHVKPEISQLDSTNTVQIPGGGVVDGLLVRRTETTVELGSGETFAIAGMLQTASNSNDAGLPGLGDTPILGSLFKSNAMTREQTELVIIVTPVLVRPVQNMAQLRLPGEGYKVPGDIDRLLLNHQVPNRDGTVSARMPGEAGFMVR